MAGCWGPLSELMAGCCGPLSELMAGCCGPLSELMAGCCGPLSELMAGCCGPLSELMAGHLGDKINNMQPSYQRRSGRRDDREISRSAGRPARSGGPARNCVAACEVSWTGPQL
ncbi:unnamed protein product [Arctogadus glacialis]